jgi:hypothetical protein
VSVAPRPRVRPARWYDRAVRLVPWSLAFALISSACGEREAAPGVGAGPLLGADEIEKSRGEILARAAANAARTCPRRVLRGALATGAPDADRLAFAEGGGPLAACVRDLAAAGEPSARFFDRRDAEALALDAACGDAVVAAARRANAHDDGCSPYQPGRRTETIARLTPVPALIKLLGLRARLVAERGQVGEAMWIVLDAARAAQDLGRGHVSLLTAMVAGAGVRGALEAGAAILAAGRPAAAEVDALVAAVDALLAAEPDFADALAGEREGFELRIALPPHQPAGWAPPGGWDDEPDRDGFGAPPELAGIELVLADAARKSDAAGCPPGATLQVCAEGLHRGDQGRQERAGEAGAALKAELDALAKEATTSAREAPGWRARITERIVAYSRDLWAAVGKYAAKRAEATIALAVLRLQLEVLRRSPLACPSAAALAAAPYAALLAPARLGDSLSATVKPGAIVVARPRWIAEDREPWRIPCGAPPAPVAP